MSNTASLTSDMNVQKATYAKYKNVVKLIDSDPKGRGRYVFEANKLSLLASIEEAFPSLDFQNGNAPGDLCPQVFEVTLVPQPGGITRAWCNGTGNTTTKSQVGSNSMDVSIIIELTSGLVRGNLGALVLKNRVSSAIDVAKE
ncbi:hypothetical protein TREMEDRAFT_66086 [Tremella mesenterica DSM 1558]|uniref:uncharacterized protein n=1 Tax=Tremella mesenterica (strain ATCC 24925 / CBS 8224 / DSM 1558 / NBRC 9311 / NRRL Y-6157 / RJB 2259-6 / UBC 559-6) TaxID=578456 RepID=UPI00032BE629|nr:uncharacterized protein TREMEDRAFT_66086 [Tremella mesenterica DSM 1558]EIW65993.1 hypothetical protein TREMEDRAFT_66086 [Tremella mesenterica DSM 1558]